MPEANITLGMDIGPALAELDKIPGAVKNVAGQANAALKLDDSGAFKKGIDGATDALTNQGKATQSLTGFLKEQRQEQRLQTYLFHESRQAIMGISMAYMALRGNTEDSTASQKKLDSAIMGGIGTFQVADFAIAGLGLASGGTAIAIAGIVAAGVGLIKFFQDSGAEIKKNAEELTKHNQLLADIAKLKLELGKGTELEYETAIQQQITAIEQQKTLLQEKSTDWGAVLQPVTNAWEGWKRIFGYIIDGFAKIKEWAAFAGIIIPGQTTGVPTLPQKTTNLDPTGEKKLELDKQVLALQVELQNAHDKFAKGNLEDSDDKAKAAEALIQLDLQRTAAQKALAQTQADSDNKLWEIEQENIIAGIKDEFKQKKAQEDKRHTEAMANIEYEAAASGNIGVDAKGNKVYTGTAKSAADSENARNVLALANIQSEADQKAIKDAKELADAKAKEITDAVTLIDLAYKQGKVDADNAIAQLKAEELLTNSKVEIARIEERILEIKNDQADKEKKLVDAAKETFTIASHAVNELVNVKDNSVRNDLNNEKKTREDALNTEEQKKLEHAKTQKQKDAINQEYAAKKDALDKEMDAKYRAQMKSSWDTQKAFAIAQATVDTYEAAAKALTAGPIIGEILAAIVIAAGLADIAVITSQQPQGLAKGTRITKPTLAMIGEGSDNEYVAPEKDFMTAAKDYLIPQTLALIARDGINVNGYRSAQEARSQQSAQISTRKMERQLGMVYDAINNLELTSKLKDDHILISAKRAEIKNLKTHI